MVDHLIHRADVVSQLREELVGPAPCGEEIDCSQRLSFSDFGEAFRPRRQAGSGEEILNRDRPTSRYGVGVLYPAGSRGGTPEDSTVDQDGPESDIGVTDAPNDPDDVITDAWEEDFRSEEKRAPRGGEPEDEDFDISGANEFAPSTMAVSFLAEVGADTTVELNASFGRYRQKKVWIGDRDWTWWLRSPVKVHAQFTPQQLVPVDGGRCVCKPASVSIENGDKILLDVSAYSRPSGGNRLRLITLALTNRSNLAGNQEEATLFQAEFEVSVTATDGRGAVWPYPKPPVPPESEEAGLRLLYRNAADFAIGHGCAADWTPDSEDPTRRARAIRAVAMPVVELPSITPDVRRADGTKIDVSMAALAGLIPNRDGFAELQDVVTAYESWIAQERQAATTLPEEYLPVAQANIAVCERASERMREGLRYLRINSDALQAFRWANNAVWVQQRRAVDEKRSLSYDTRRQRIYFEPAYAETPAPSADVGRWRAFQIAFLLMSIESASESDAVDRELVDLIWFPTGGGKTEAYLGLAAFTMFLRRLRNPSDTGVSVLMRYTLRLLTAQQFQRASRLITAMDMILEDNKSELGVKPFSIGIWLGTATTPNARKYAVPSFRKLRKGKPADDWLLVTECPWCGAEMGSVEGDRSWPSYVPRVYGYRESGGTVELHCPDNLCDFASGLPIFLVDEDVYENQPSLVIGTADKFAMLAWRPEARAIFGLGVTGRREYSPPGLIIQDELHLISGPLGSLFGLYEPVIEALCTDTRGGEEVRPKIVASTATIRRYREQILALYGRERSALFPPPALDAGNSFFSRHARNDDGELSPGRIHIGVHAPGLGSMPTAQTRTFGALLQAPVPFNKEARDPWWTVMAFYNSLRELGTALSLLQSDVPDYLRSIRNRKLGEDAKGRPLYNLLELTGRLRNEEVPRAIESLEAPTTSPGSYPVDVCIASNIIEVGIDIDRLSLMVVVGQPKTTAQYIQVTGRVGRRWWERPGVVVTLYSPSKARDRSHYEKFRSYHERLYAQVEPTSVTPFSRPALERALHAVMTAYVRQQGDGEAANSPYPFPSKLVSDLLPMLRRRVVLIDPDELEVFDEIFDRRTSEWKNWERLYWTEYDNDEDIPLLRAAGAYVSQERRKLSWPTPMSLRTVDAECQIEITQHYLQEADDA